MRADLVMWDSRSGALKPLAGIVALWSMTLAGCQRDRFGCDSQVEAGQWNEALASCTAAFEASGQPRWGKQAAFATFNLADDDGLQEWLERLRGTLFESTALGYRAYRFFSLGDVERAEADYLRALELDEAGGRDEGIASSSFYLYYLAWNSSRYREAYEHAARGHNAAMRADDPYWTRLNAEALTTVFLTVGDLQRARNALTAAQASLGTEAPESAYLQSYEGLVHVGDDRPALALRSWRGALETAAGSNDQRLLRSLHLNIVELELEAGNTSKARQHLDEAWTHADEATDRTGLLFYRAAVLRAEDRLPDALADLDQAAATTNTDWGWQIELARGEILEDLGRLDEAVAAYERSADHVEALRRDLELNALKSSLLDRRRRPFERLFTLAALAGRHEAALSAYERIKARSFLDALVEVGRSAIRTPRTEDGSTRQGETRAGRSASATVVGSAVGEQVEAISELVSTVNSLGTSPSFSPLPIEELPAELSRHEIAAFLVTTDRVWLVRLGPEVPQGRRFFLLGIDPLELDRAIDRLVGNPDDEETAERLGSWLFPDGALPPEGETLYIVPDRRLGNLPFAALRMGDRFLIERFALAQVPSLTAMSALPTARPLHEPSTERSSDSSSPDSVLAPALVIGDPTEDLPEARTEAHEVAGVLGVNPIVGAQATRAVLADATRHSLLHFASHAGLDSGGPWLELADGRLGASEILNDRLAAEIVVLASCNSGAREGSGLWGSLAATFLAAGSRTVVASLWSLDDRLARELIVDFYGHGGAIDPIAAMSRVQRTAIDAGRPAIEWAPLTVLGTSPATAGAGPVLFSTTSLIGKPSVLPEEETK